MELPWLLDKEIYLCARDTVSLAWIGDGSSEKRLDPVLRHQAEDAA